MKRTIVFLAAIVLFAAAMFFPRQAAAEFRAGAGRVDITPNPGCYLGGYYYENERAKGVHDPLHGRVIVFDNGKTKIAFAVMDLIMMNISMSEEIKKQVNAEFGIPIENINISVIHTHTGPEGYYGEYGKYPKEFVPEMKAELEAKMLVAFRQAMKNLAPATVGFEMLQLEGYGGNRRDPNGFVDKTAVLLTVKDASGKPFAGFLNFNNHPTIVPVTDLLISGDWAGQFETMMEEKMGSGSVFMYLNGASGDIGTPARGDGDGWQRAENAARAFTDELFPKLAPMKTSGDIALAAARKDYTFPIRTRKSVTDFNKAIPGRIHEIKNSGLSDEEKKLRISLLNGRYGIESFMQMLFPTMSRVKSGKTKTLAEAFRIGDLLLLTFPGEPVSEYSIQIRQKMGARPVAVLGYSNDHLGYFATKRIYDEGGYEAGMGLIPPEAMDTMVADLEAAGDEMFAK